MPKRVETESLQISTSVSVNSSIMHDTPPLSTRSHTGFSLIELLIVIALISLFGFMVFGSMKKSAIKKEPYGIKNLKKVFKTASDAELLCIDKCTKCFIRTPGDTALQEVESELTELQAYIVDKDDNPQKIDFGRMDDHPICLRFRYYANGSTTQIILESEDKYFYFPSYFGKISIHTSIEEAADKWVENTKLLTSQGNYYK